MGVNVALPVGILAGLAAAMLIFVCWWFPRHYKKGVALDMARVDEERAQREAAERGEGGQLEMGNTQDASSADTRPKVVPRAYIAPVTPY